MKCPVCKNPELRPTMIEELLPSMGCEQCKGSLVSLLYYRHWAEHHKPHYDSPPPASVMLVPDTVNVLRCPKCERIMTKYRISGTVSNRLDVCPGCDESWLDGGEWQLLEQLQLSDKLPSVFTEAWQRKVRSEANEHLRREGLRRVIGDEDASKVEALRSWLNAHPSKTTILTYLYRE